MAWPQVVILIEHLDGPILYRYGADAEFAGDTWHENAHDAKEAAEVEYSESLEGDWSLIPDNVPSGAEVTWALEQRLQ